MPRAGRPEIAGASLSLESRSFRFSIITSVAMYRCARLSCSSRIYLLHSFQIVRCVLQSFTTYVLLSLLLWHLQEQGQILPHDHLHNEVYYNCKCADRRIQMCTESDVTSVSEA